MSKACAIMNPGALTQAAKSSHDSGPSINNKTQQDRGVEIGPRSCGADFRRAA